MAFRATRIALLLASLSLAGCGTAANVVRSRPEAGGRVPFGGVKRDMAYLTKAVNTEADVGPAAKSEAERYPRSALMLFCAVDLPFSLVGDLVTLPYTASYSLINQPIPLPPVTQALPPAPPPAVPPMPLPEPPEPKAAARVSVERARPGAK